MPETFYNNILQITKNHVNEPNKIAIEIQRYVNSFLMEQRMATSESRSAGYTVGWNGAVDKILKKVNENLKTPAHENH